jgi:hypothetical protein
VKELEDLQGDEDADDYEKDLTNGVGKIGSKLSRKKEGSAKFTEDEEHRVR